MDKIKSKSVKEDVKYMLTLARWFKQQNITPFRAISIMAFTIYTIFKAGEDLKKWE